MGVINDKDYCVYMHTNKHNSKVYIGITSQKPEDRWGNNGIKYFDKRKDGEYRQTVFARALKKYPDWEEDWEHTILAEHLSQEEAVTMEIELIALYKSNCSSRLLQRGNPRRIQQKRTQFQSIFP